MNGLEEMLRRLLECHGKAMPETVADVETALSMVIEDRYEEGVREGVSAKPTLAELAA